MYDTNYEHICVLHVLLFHMNAESPVGSVEVFNLTLLEVLQVRLSQDKYVLKGGANLRFFFNSPRYSEVMDFDAVCEQRPVDTVRYALKRS
jgi:hypothetical protein